MRKTFFLIIMLLLTSTVSFAQISSAATGNWNAGATWTGGVVPKATDDVVIAAGHVVTIDIVNAACKNISIDGTLSFPDVDALGITINGNVTINATGKFYTFVTGSTTGIRNQTITILGDLKVVSGGNIDFRRGSNPNVGVGTLVFAGATTSNVYLTQTVYGSSIEEFNSITINKTSPGKVILKTGNLYMSNNSTTAPTILTLTSGLVETEGTSVWGFLATSATNLVGGSATSYFKGALGRGISNSAASVRTYPVGDANGYRPMMLKSSSGTATGHMVIVQTVSGNANTGSSTFAGGIDKVSAARYYKLSYTKSGAATAASSVSIDTLGVSYATGDGVAANNSNLRVAYSSNERALWTGAPQTTAHITALTSPPTMIVANQLTTPFSISETSVAYVALARMSGTTENTLVGSSSIEKQEGLPSLFTLSQNYPNPFNPTTLIKFSIPQDGFTSLKVFNSIGQEVTVLVNQDLKAGNYTFSFSANELSSGIYFYKLQSNNFTSTKKMLLVK